MDKSVDHLDNLPKPNKHLSSLSNTLHQGAGSVEIIFGGVFTKLKTEILAKWQRSLLILKIRTKITIVVVNIYLADKTASSSAASHPERISSHERRRFQTFDTRTESLKRILTTLKRNEDSLFILAGD